MKPIEYSWQEISDKFVENDNILVEEYTDYVYGHGNTLESQISFLKTRIETTMTFVNIIIKKMAEQEQKGENNNVDKPTDSN